MSAPAPQTEAQAHTRHDAQSTDPRIRRTHKLLHQALEKLLKTKDFDKISVQDIADAATLNRATFYDHYTDKFALLECMVAGQLTDLLESRNAAFDGTCVTALRVMILAVCDFLAGLPSPSQCQSHQNMEPRLEAAIINVLKSNILTGLQQHPVPGLLSQEMAAAAASWAIYGAAKEWLRTPSRCTSEHTADLILTLVARILTPVEAAQLLPVHG